MKKKEYVIVLGWEFRDEHGMAEPKERFLASLEEAVERLLAWRLICETVRCDSFAEFPYTLWQGAHRVL